MLFLLTDFQKTILSMTYQKDTLPFILFKMLQLVVIGKEWGVEKQSQF